MVKNGMNMSTIKNKNKNAILSYINDIVAVSRIDVAEATGLTGASVTQLTTELIRDGYLREIGLSDEVRHKAGRKKILLELNPEYAYVITVNIEPEITSLALVNFQGKALTIKKLKTNKAIAAEEYLNFLILEIKEIINSLSSRNKNKVKAVSVGITGNVDKEKGISIFANGIWNKSVSIKDILEKELNIPVLVENNIKALSLAELLYGIGRKCNSFMVIKWGPGLGSAFITDNKVYEGYNGQTAEIGHVIVDSNGEKCSCGRSGCLETKISYTALRNIMNFNPDTFESDYLNSNLETKKRIDEIISLLARTIVNSGVLFFPKYIILEGSLFSNKIIRNKLIEYCKSFDQEYDENRILFSELYNQEEYIGLAAVFVNKFLY